MSKPLALIIEDDFEIANIMSISLANEFETEQFADGRAALSRLAQVIPMLIILDLHLPSLSGTDIFARVRSDARLETTKVILCTADALRAESLRSQADIVLLKPISPAQLRQLASRLIGEPR
ncbi:MAG TPA: response regulator [Anaerolineales bacterium]|nr:response regulator [Anaerolineales bacterium]